jgi:segregation and condensation protein A
MMQIKVQQFEGPLALLLELIEQQKLDITAVSIAHVTEQFLDYVKNLQEKNPVNLADFLIIAAKLLVIKSRSLLPDLDLGIEEDEAAFDLTEQLLIYKKYKEASKYLKRLDGRRKQSWSKEPEIENIVSFTPDPDVTISTLHKTLQTLSVELKEIQKLPQQMMKRVMSISEKIEQIQKILTEKVEMKLSSLIHGAKDKTEVIVTFLALLELIKQRILIVDQTEMFADIIIKKNT